MEITRLKLKEYLRLPDTSEYNFAIKHGAQFHTEEDVLGIKDIHEVSFGIIKDFQTDLQGGDLTLEKQIEYIGQVLPDLDMDEQYMDEICRTASWMLEQVIMIIETEGEMLVSEPTGDEVDFDGFNALGVIMQIRYLAGNDVLKYQAIRDMKYQTCFVELYARKQEVEYQRLINNKQKEKNKT